MATHDPDANVRGHAAVALGSFGKSPAAEAVPAAIAGAFGAEPDPGVRERLMWTIARFYATAAPPALLDAGLAAQDDLTRVAAVRALGKRTADPAAPALARRMLDDPSWRVQYEAREALLTLSGKTRTEHLKSIPSGVHVPALPAPVSDQTAGGAGLPPNAKPSPPAVAGVAPLALSIAGSASMLGEPLQREGRPRVRIVTSKGAVTLVLFSDWAPYTVASFLSLAQRGYFNGTRWFRIVPDFVVQTGDRTNTGEGDPGYTIPGEARSDRTNLRHHLDGLDYGAKVPSDSGGSQFYLRSHRNIISILCSPSSAK